MLDPRSVPVIGVDGHLQAIAPSQLSASAVRMRLAGIQGDRAEILGDAASADLFPNRPSAAASVLVPLVAREQGLTVLLTRRSEHLRDHAGQISFPGGRREPEDADEVATALRESAEEIGLDAKHVEVLGQLPTYHTVSHFIVTPVVGLVAELPPLQPDPFEVAEVFEVPLAFLMAPANHQSHLLQTPMQTRQFLSMPWLSPEGREYFIWGATAAMLRNLYRVLAAPPSQT